MGDGENHVLGFRAAIERNRQIFSLQRPYAYFAFFGICELFQKIGRRLQTGRDTNGKPHVGLLPFLLIIQRQAMSAFETLATCRSYEAWVPARAGLESALTMGKWVDDPENAAIWDSRHTRKKEYIKTFSGQGIVSISLPRSADIRGVLDRLNDEFVHANEPYYSRHTTAEPLPDGNIFLRLEFFDDDDDREAHSLAFLHLMALIADSLDAMLANKLPETGAHKPSLDRVKEALREHASRIRDVDPAHDTTLSQLGLWLREKS